MPTLPEPPGADVFDGVQRAPCSAAGAELDDPLVLRGRLDHPPAFDDVVAGGFLRVDVPAGLASEDGSTGRANGPGWRR